MSFFDDLKARAEESYNSVSGDIQSYLKDRVMDVVVKAGEPPKGNQTAAQIANGQAGGPAQVIAQASSFAKYLPLLIVAGIAYVAFSGKGK